MAHLRWHAYKPPGLELRAAGAARGRRELAVVAGDVARGLAAPHDELRVEVPQRPEDGSSFLI